MKLLIFIGMNLGGFVGWSLGENYGVWIAFLGGSVGSVLGVYLGWRVARYYLA
jgi:hypothetical protein